MSNAMEWQSFEGSLKELRDKLGRSLSGVEVRISDSDTYLIGDATERGIVDSCDCCTEYIYDYGTVVAYRERLSAE